MHSINRRDFGIAAVATMLEQAFRQNAGERRHIKLNQIGKIAVEHAFQRLAERGMIATNRKNAKSAQ